MNTETPKRPVEPEPLPPSDLSQLPPNSEERKKAEKERDKACEKHNKAMEKFNAELKAWNEARRAYEGFNEGKRIGDPIAADPVKLENLDLRNAQASQTKPKRGKQAKVTAHDLGDAQTVTAVKQGLPDPAAEITIEHGHLETPEELVYKLDDGKQWMLW